MSLEWKGPQKPCAVKLCQNRISKFSKFQFNERLFLRMLEEKGRLIALYDPKMGHLSKFLDVGWELPHPKIQMWNAAKYNYAILLLEINNSRFRKK